ncbi:unnamed protein product [Strongylus vulgaris]|uniref:EF-hand domain-containing protein n=1 Tax=Strongylus vulgaris TaxID=40348 RepID=A0A3P7J402_STRVU|nr:unnamed protein product [Strongylus vulgaris]
MSCSGLEQCIPFMRFDHFTGNEVTYIFTLIGLGCIPLICFGIGYILIQRRRRMGWDISYDDLSATAVDDDAPKDRYSIQAFEWLDECYVRQVIVEFAPGILTVRKPRGQILRKMIFPENADITVYHSEPNASTIHGPYCLIKLKKTHDLVLRLPSDKHLPEFLAALTLCLKKFDGRVTSIATPNEVLLEKAETKERRQQRLDHFFREAYARAFDQPKLSDATNREHDSDDILNQTITKSELAQAMGMRENDVFVERMFAVTSRTDSDVITFAEFLEVLKQFNEG